MPGDDTDPSVLLDMGNDHVLLDNVDDTENISQSALGELHPQSTTSRSGRKMNLPARFFGLVCHVHLLVPSYFKAGLGFRPSWVNVSTNSEVTSV